MTLADGRLISLQAAALLIALGTALVWPRVGQAAEVMPLGTKDLSDVLRWADNEDAEIVELDSSSGRIVVRIPSNFSLLTALGSGLLPTAAPRSGCEPEAKQKIQGAPT